MIVKKKISYKARKSKGDLLYCQLCEQLAICNAYTCYKKKQGDYNCSSCEERLCKTHWQKFFKRHVQ